MLKDISMQSVKTLFRLDLRSRFGSTQKKSAKTVALQVCNYLFYALVYAVLIVGIYYLSKLFVTRSNLGLEFLSIVATLTIAIATVVATGNVIKNLYMNGDNEMLLRFPVSGAEILLSKSIYCYLHNLVVCFAIMMPFYVVFGVVSGAAVGDYFSYIAITLFSSFLPFFIANIIAVPVMKVMNVVKNQFLLVLILTICAICGIFVLYLESLGNVVQYLQNENQSIFSGEMIAKYRAFANNAYPFVWYAELINGTKYLGLSSAQMFLRFLYLFLINGALGVAAYFITVKQYYKTILYGIETEKTSFTKKNVKKRQRSQFEALFRREFYLILRSFNYSFQYFAMAVAAPVMVFFCDRLAASSGAKSLGVAIMPGLTLLVITIFIAITVSFASTTISREGDCFYHTKIIPVSFTKQIGVKFFLYSIVATTSVVLSCVILGGYYTSDAGNHALTALDIGAIFGICEMTVISLTCLSMWADIKSPTFNVGGDGELVAANKNVALSMVVGILIAAAFGVFAMVFSFLPLQIGSWQVVKSIKDIYIILAIVSAIILVLSVSLLFVNLNKRYHKIAA